MEMEQDLEKMSARTSALEKQKAQYELMTQQVKELKADLEERLKAAGTTLEELDGKIAELSRSVNDRLREAESQPAGV